MTDQQEAPMTITIGESFGRGVPNFTVEGAKFFGKPNFAGEMNQFRDNRRQFTIVIPDEAVGPLRQFGYNVKLWEPDAEAQAAGREPIHHLKVFLNFKADEKYPEDVTREKGPDVFVKQGEDLERLTSITVGMLDRSRLEHMDVEIRGWEYDPEEEPGKLSARLVMFVGVLRANIIEAKYGRLR